MPGRENTLTWGDRFRTGLLAFGLGLLLTLATIVQVKFISNDMRWVLWLGSIGFLGAASWVGHARRGGFFSLLCLCSPLTLVWATLVVPQLPGMWPHLFFWLGFALLGGYGIRYGSRARPLSLAVLVMLTLGSFWYATAYIPGAISRSLSEFRNDPAPDFILVHLDGTPYPMESLQGKVVVLDFFGTWCAPCIAELPELEEVQHRTEALGDVMFLVVANDSGGDTPESIQAFVDTHDMDLPFVYDPDGRAHAAFGFAGLPGLVVIDRAGNIRLTREGYNAAETRFQENLVGLIESI